LLTNGAVLVMDMKPCKRLMIGEPRPPLSLRQLR
jgi:hypothetical protein